MSQQDTMRDRYNWKKVEAPKPWKPRVPGEELLGFYAGQSKRQGQFGEYTVVMIAVPGEGLRMVSGARIVQLVDAAALTPGEPVRIVWHGNLPLKGDRTYNSYDLFKSDGEALPEDQLPSWYQEGS